MTGRSHQLSLVEAVETLSNIADLDFEQEIRIVQKHEILLDDQLVDYKTVHWLHQQDPGATIGLVKEIFRVVLHYLRQFYTKEYKNITDQTTMDGIKTIMVLVGEAARKLDNYTSLFPLNHPSIKESKEYKQLQDFYFSKISRQVDEGIIGKWILGLELSKKQKIEQDKTEDLSAEKEKLTTKYAFVDLETVKRDTEYELFFIRKEDGSRFFSPRLLRNIKLVCDFGRYFNTAQVENPLQHFDQWLDKIMHMAAKNVFRVLSTKIEHFYNHLSKTKHHETVDCLRNALMALMLSSHASNLLKHHPIKSCTEYFVDFQLFLRKALQTTSYQKWLAYPPKESNHLAIDTLDLIHSICKVLYLNLQGLEEMSPIVRSLIQEASSSISKEHHDVALASHQIWSRLASDYVALNKLIKKHPNGPIIHLLTTLEQGNFRAFDPFLQSNIPNQLFDLYADEQKIAHIRFPTPITQEFIQKAQVIDEFKGLMRFYAAPNEKKKHLLINLQDRTSWREHARSVIVEELQFDPTFADSLCVVTLAVDTDFYHQLAPYHQMNHVNLFMEQFKEHLQGDGYGFFFPKFLHKKLDKFINESLKAIHRIFFSNKNVLSREQRIDFIEIFYMFLQLKLIDWIRPDSFSLTCKDGVDTGTTYSVEIFALLTLLHRPDWGEVEINHLNAMLYAPALLNRERILLAEKFNRLLSAIRTIENVCQELNHKAFLQTIQEAFDLPFALPILSNKLSQPFN